MLLSHISGPVCLSLSLHLIFWLSVLVAHSPESIKKEAKYDRL